MPQKMDKSTDKKTKAAAVAPAKDPGAGPAPRPAKDAPPYIYRRFYPEPFGDAAFAVVAVGIEEIMPPGVVDRPQGTGDRLLIFYPAGMAVRDVAGEATAAVDSGMLWACGAGHHYGLPDRPWRHSWVNFKGAACEALVAECGAVAGRAVPADYAAAVRHLTALTREIASARPHSPAICRHLLAALLLELGRGAGPGEAVPAAIARARQRIEQDYREPLDLASLAHEACLSRSHFAAEFRRWHGISPIAYQLRLRLREAAYLLRDRNLRVAEIAARLGFQDAYYFSRAFHKEYGMGPRAYREAPTPPNPLALPGK